MRLNGPDAGREELQSPEEGQQPPLYPEETTARIRLRFRKTGKMRFLSHLEMINLFSRGVARARIPIRFSQGFHPHPKFSFATALSVGVESRAEYMDMEIAAGFGAARVKEHLNSVLPEGMEILDACEIPLRSPSLSVIMDKVRYRVTLPGPVALDLHSCVENFLSRETWPIRREKKGKAQEIDLRRELHELKADAVSLEMLVGRGKPLEFAAAVTGLAPEELAEARIEKLDVIFKDSDSNII
jgi:radical SAM-linked protein